MSDRPGATDLAPDEKLCPFCAETIKKAAVKCRYCQSDLPLEEPVQQPAQEPAASSPDPLAGPLIGANQWSATESAPPPQAPRPTEGGGEVRTVRSGWLGSFRLMIGLLVLCLVLAGVTAFGWYRSEHPADAGGSGDAITSTSARDAGLEAATRLTEKIFTYDWKTFDQDASSSEKLLGPSFRKEYADTISKTRQSAVANQVKQTARASATSIVSASDRKVVALVFMNVLASGKAGSNRVSTSRLLVTLTPHDGDWRISQLKQL